MREAYPKTGGTPFPVCASVGRHGFRFPVEERTILVALQATSLLLGMKRFIPDPKYWQCGGLCLVVTNPRLPLCFCRCASEPARLPPTLTDSALAVLR